MPRISVRLPNALARVAGASELNADADTVRDTLGALDRQHHGLSDNIVDERGRVRQHVLIFLGDTDIRELDGLDSKLKAGDVLTVVAAVSGG